MATPDAEGPGPTLLTCLLWHGTVEAELRMEAWARGSVGAPCLTLRPNPRGFTGAPSTSLHLDSESMRALGRMLIAGAEKYDREHEAEMQRHNGGGAGE